MSRFKEITATATVAPFIMPFPPLSSARFEASGIHLGGLQRVETINDVVVPKLQPGWEQLVLSRFPGSLNRAQTQTLEASLVAYIRGRVAVINPIHWKDFHSRLERFAQISRALLNELNDATPAFNLAWSKIGESSEGMTGTRLDRDELYPALSKLHGAALHALDGANRRREEGREGEHDAPWLALVSTLAELFEASGGKATAPKSRRDGSYANPSAFVELVWAIMMQIIPSEVCEFTHSKGAMADAISGALTKWRNRTF